MTHIQRPNIKYKFKPNIRVRSKKHKWLKCRICNLWVITYKSQVTCGPKCSKINTHMKKRN